MMRTGRRHAEPCAGWPVFVRFLDSAERRLCAQVEYRNGSAYGQSTEAERPTDSQLGLSNIISG